MWERLCQIMKDEAGNFIPPIIIVELCQDDGKTYEKKSHPGRVAGRIALYHHDSRHSGKTPHTSEQSIKPSETVQDTTNYLQSESKPCDRTLVYKRSSIKRSVPGSNYVASAALLVGARNEESVYEAPIVIDDNNVDQGGGVIGFFQLGAHGSRWALSPCLDDLIESGWGLVETCM